MFGAALAQFDELLRAAGSVGPSVSPIPLYYALTQAGRAIAAAHVRDEDWRASGHGLSVKSASGELGETVVEPHPGQRNQFSVFCRAIQSAPLTSSASLSEIWATIPQLEQVSGLGAEKHPAIPLIVTTSREGLGLHATIRGSIAHDLPNDLTQAGDVLRARLSAYPGTAAGLVVRSLNHARQRAGSEAEVEVEWRSEDGTLRSVNLVAPGLGPTKAGSYLWPGIGAKNEVLTPLASWWIALLALSSLARYEPDKWLAALDRDQSVTALPIEEALDIAAEMLPWYVLHALRNAS